MTPKIKVSDSLFPAYCKQQGLPIPVAEFAFHPTRKFRFDWAWPDRKLALEVDGGVWTRGAHGRGAGILRDQEKTNLAATLGWRVLRTVPKDLYTMGDTIRLALTFDVTQRGA